MEEFSALRQVSGRDGLGPGSLSNITVFQVTTLLLIILKLSLTVMIIEREWPLLLPSDT